MLNGDCDVIDDVALLPCAMCLTKTKNSCLANPLLSRQEGIQVMSSFYLIDIRLAVTHYEPPPECPASRRLYSQGARGS